MFFQEPTPDTSGYMIAGFAIAFLVMALYVASLYMRNRNLSQDLESLEEMDKFAGASRAKIPAKPAEKKKSDSVTKRKEKK
jgi:hypothetical protein